MIARHGERAAGLVRIEISRARAQRDDLSAEAWHDIARAVAEELRDFKARRR
jgi:hypothetical protein